ncbi:MAG: HK97 gp10 family phage protein [Oscillospiraceae bacterium]|nr:HK97 gp10 family phage protein [Oscillospiraceae bacterium]
MRKHSVIDLDDLAQAVKDNLQEYNEYVNAEMKKAIRKTANSIKKEISVTAPKDTEHYAKTWRIAYSEDSIYSFRSTVHAKDYQIAHLLENGHALRRGGRTIGDGSVSPKPHIEPAREHGEQLLTELIEKVL